MLEAKEQKEQKQEPQPADGKQEFLDYVSEKYGKMISEDEVVDTTRFRVVHTTLLLAILSELRDIKNGKSESN